MFSTDLFVILSNLLIFVVRFVGFFLSNLGKIIFYSEFRKISSMFSSVLFRVEVFFFVLKYSINFWVIHVHLKV